MNAPKRVHVLPTALANQIAAGEVIERPISVVKELVENALDAGATAIFVDIEEGGLRLIRVVDDGDGMGRQDAELSLERHATSKITHIDDLHGITTLGFRGEALPSIASVSRFKMVTRIEDETAGTEIRVEGGEALQVLDAGGAVGTRVEVRDLFFNVPARLKFIKRPATEMSHISSLITSSALGYPHVQFRLTHNGRVTQHHPVAPSLKQRIFQVLGTKVSDRLYEVRNDGPLRIRGYISEPTFSRTNQKGIFTFINGRWVKDRVVNHALIGAYGNILDRGRFPQGVLYIHISPEQVDVNVHPTKAEVRFVTAGHVHETIVAACRATLSMTPWLERNHAPAYQAGTFEGARPSWGVAEPRRSLVPMDAHGLSRDRQSTASAVPRDWGPSQELSFDAPATDGAPTRAKFFSHMRVIGQAERTYLLCEGHGGLHIIDQHAAHERVGYERIKQGYCSSKLVAQPLLLPLQIEFTASEADALADHVEVLEGLGIRIEPFGGQTWQITSVPALLSQSNIETLVRDVVAELTDIGRATMAESKLDHLFSTMACHSVVRAGDQLKHEEIRALLEMMDEVDLGANCPHGRPVLWTLPFSDLARKFHRT